MLQKTAILKPHVPGIGRMELVDLAHLLRPHAFVPIIYSLACSAYGAVNISLLGLARPAQKLLPRRQRHTKTPTWGNQVIGLSNSPISLAYYTHCCIFSLTVQTVNYNLHFSVK